MVGIIIGLFGAAFSALGFALMFRVRKRHLFVIAFGGLLSYAVYIPVQYFFGGEFFPNLAAAIVTAVFAELCAHTLRAPVQIYLIPMLIPLFPGGFLYYTMYHLLSSEYVLFTKNLLFTLEAAFALSGGMIIGLAVTTGFLSIFSRMRRKKCEKAKK